MKIALITDQHYGVRADSKAFLDYYEKFNKVIFDRLAEGDIDHVMLLGDLFDRRKNINFYTLNRCKRDFLDPLAKTGLPVDIIVGNHDAYFKNTNRINAVEELLHGYEFSVWTGPKTVNVGNVPVLLLPWICEDNREATLKEIKKTSAKVCFGHLELQGFDMHKGLKAMDGDKQTLFAKFDVVASGHFHTRSSKGNIEYIGAAYEQSWSDYGDPRGFSIFDTKTNKMEFIENPHSIYRMISYNDEFESDLTSDMKSDMFARFKDTYVKVLVLKRENEELFDRFVQTLTKAEPHDITIIESELAYLEGDDDEIENVEDTITILNQYIEGLTTDLSHQKIMKFMQEVYAESLELEKSYANG